MRNKGTSNYSGNFEVKFVEPIDSRSRVQTKNDLTDSNVWQSSDGSIYLYDGLIVSVYADSIVDNNGLYRLKLASGYTNISNWEKVGSGSGHTIQDSTGTPVVQRTNLRFNNTIITDDSQNNTTIISGIKGDSGADGQSFVPDKRGPLTDAEVATGELNGSTDNYYFILIDPNGDDRTDPLTVAPSLVGNMGGHLVAYNGTTWIDYGQLVGVKGDTGDTGEKGDKGDTGLTGLNFVGDYVESATYSFRDAVRMTGNGADAGNVYYCNVLEITQSDNKIPGVSSDWKLLVEKGQQGIQGPQGEQGVPGSDALGELIMKPFYVYLPTNKSFGRYIGTGSQYEITAIPNEGWTVSEFLRHVAFESTNPTVSIVNNTPNLTYNQTSDVNINLSITRVLTTPGASFVSSKIEMSRDGSTWTDKGSLTFTNNVATYIETLSLGGNNTSDIRYRVTVTDSNGLTGSSTSTKSFPSFTKPTLATAVVNETWFDYGNVAKTSSTYTINRVTVGAPIVNYSVYIELGLSGTKTKYGNTIQVSNIPSELSSVTTVAIAIDSSGNIIIDGNTYSVPNIKTQSNYRIWLRIESDIIGSSNDSTDLMVHSRSFGSKIYYGSSTNSNITALSQNQLTTLVSTTFTPVSSSISTRDYVFGALASSYKWIMIPTSVTSPTYYKSGGFDVAMQSEVVTTYNNEYGMSIDYKFIRTTNATSSPLTITAS